MAFGNSFGGGVSSGGSGVPADGSITAIKLASDSVTTIKILDANVTTAKIADANVTPAKLSQPFTAASPLSVSGVAAATFTGIPSWARAILVSLDSVVISSASAYEVRIGSGSVDAAGYDSAANYGINTGQFVYSTTGFVLLPANQTGAAIAQQGNILLIRNNNNVWTSFSGVTNVTTQLNMGGSGRKSLAGVLDRISLTNQGAVNFSSGNVNIGYFG